LLFHCDNGYANVPECYVIILSLSHVSFGTSRLALSPTHSILLNGHYELHPPSPKVASGQAVKPTTHPPTQNTGNKLVELCLHSPFVFMAWYLFKHRGISTFMDHQLQTSELGVRVTFIYCNEYAGPSQ
jgi:hypothetical protein